VRALLLFSALSCSAIAQQLPWIDLSGDWRIKKGDNPGYSDPALDDSRWRIVRLPGNIPVQPGEFFWLRRTVRLAPDVDKTHLTLTLGKTIENYDLFINGTPIWSSGPFDKQHTQIARPRSFDLPSLQSDRLTIAVRGWSHQFRGSSTWRRGPDPGPYLVTGTVNAPRAAGSAAIEHMRMQRGLELVFGVTLLTLTVILLLIFANQPSRKELLWLALSCAVVAWLRLRVVLLVTEDGRPWDTFLPVLSLPGIVVLLEFAMSALGVYSRIVRALAWGALALALLWPGTFDDVPAIRLVEALAAIVLIWSVSRRNGRTPERLLVAAGVAIVFVYDALQNGVRPGSFIERIRTPVVNIGPYQSSQHPIVLTIFAFVMVTVLIRRLLADSAEKQRLAGELEAARTVQQLLFPVPAASAGEYALEAIYEPSQEVGGDFYQVLDRSDGSRLILVGDVSGKGLKAAMLVSVAVGALLREKSSSPAVVLAGLNETLTGHTGGGFITCCCLRIEPGGRATFASAGHLPPYLRGHEMEVEASLPLGILADAHYAELSYALAPGDQITLVSDGVVEAANAKGELFGFDRTREVSGKAAIEITNLAKAWGQNDDITVVTVRRLT
jgi:sigma-B regulation protein RsbU (phosphoserine phosphatase)